MCGKSSAALVALLVAGACGSSGGAAPGSNGAGGVGRGGSGGSNTAPGSGGGNAAGGGNASGGAVPAQGGQGGQGPSPGSGGSESGDAGAPPNETGAPPDPGTPAALPTRALYLEVLQKLCDTLLATQISTAGAQNFGALVSPSTNPERMPIHSRAAEAVYPLAVLFKHATTAKYGDAAVALGDWLVSIQAGNGGWIEEWPDATGWDGTTADQLISLAGAYPLVKARLSAQQSMRWEASIRRAADFIEAGFPKGNINYQPTGAVALVLAHKAVAGPKASWLTKASSLMTLTLAAINNEQLLTGEGDGVDLGYNIAQSIGFVAMYARLTSTGQYLARAKAMLGAHTYFMYPNGAIDNSWGTRSYKWMLESGTKTAPGVYFSFALLADDGLGQRGAQLALDFLRRHALDDKGWIAYGPHASRHPSSSPPSNYATFARAQSIATAIEFGPAEPVAPGKIPADESDWSKYFTSVKTAVVRTPKVMATATAYGVISRYPRESVARGGSITALWWEGYGPTGFLQVSSQTSYNRVEAKHMPTESMLLPLTPRLETTGGGFTTNLYDHAASLDVKAGTSSGATGTTVTATGTLRTATGAAGGPTFTWIYEFDGATLRKTVRTPTGGIRVVEPFVDNPGNTYELVGTDTFLIRTMSGKTWQLKVTKPATGVRLVAGEDRARHWAPFPGIDAYPLAIVPEGNGAVDLAYTISEAP